MWEVLGKIPQMTGEFFEDNKQPLISLGIILLAPTLQLIGMGYTAWFIWRYLWKAEKRQELASEFGALKEQIFGG